MTLPRRAVKQSGYGGRGYRPLPHSDKSTPILPSVTTILKNEAKPALQQWAADQTAAYAIANADELMRMSDAKAWGFLRWFWNREPKDPLSSNTNLATFHEGVLSDAGELGDSVHEWVEADLFPDAEYPDVTDRNDKFWDCVDAWNAFKAEHDIVPHRTEVTVWNDREDGLGYAGTFDLQCEIDGKMYLIDIKTSRGLYSSTWMQLAALYNAPVMLDEEDGKDRFIADWNAPIEGLGVIHIRPDDISSRGEHMPAFAKLVEMPYENERFFQSFMGLRTYAEGLKGMKL